MAVTRIQVNALVARSTLLILQHHGLRHPEVINLFVRAAIKEAKDVGGPIARETLKATLTELYTLLYGNDPIGDRTFFKWIQHSLHVETNMPNPITGVSYSDAFEAEEVIIV